MAIFWTSWLVATNMTPFAMTFHSRFQAAQQSANHRIYAQKQLQLFLGLYFCVSWTFAFHCRSGHLQTCRFSLFTFRLFQHLSQKPPFAPRDVSCCRLLSLLQCSGSTSVVSLLSVLLCLSCTLITRRHFLSLEHFLPGSAGRVFYFTPLLTDSELVHFAGAVLSLLGHYSFLYVCF